MILKTHLLVALTTESGSLSFCITGADNIRVPFCAGSWGYATAGHYYFVCKSFVFFPQCCYHLILCSQLAFELLYSASMLETCGDQRCSCSSNLVLLFHAIQLILHIADPILIL